METGTGNPKKTVELQRMLNKHICPTLATSLPFFYALSSRFSPTYHLGKVRHNPDLDTFSWRLKSVSAVKIINTCVGREFSLSRKDLGVVYFQEVGLVCFLPFDIVPFLNICPEEDELVPCASTRNVSGEASTVVVHNDPCSKHPHVDSGGCLRYRRSIAHGQRFACNWSLERAPKI